MRSPTLLTGVTGAVAVLVFVYVGLTEMGLQPHISFGDPNVRVASADKTPNPGPATASGAPVVSTAPSAAVPAQAPVAVVPPVPPATATQEAPPKAVLPVPAPAMPIAVPQTPPSPVTTAQPAAVPLPSTSASPAWLPSVPAEAALPGPAMAEGPPASVEPSPRPPVVASAEPAPPPTSDVSISERMAPTSPPPAVSTPPTPPTPRVASVPTPLARPTPTAAEDAETPPIVAEAKPPAAAEEVPKPATAETLPSDDKRGQVDRAAPPPLDNRPPPSESAALAPQPGKAPEDAASIEQPNGALKPVDLSRPFAERAGILTIGGRSVQLAGVVPTDPERSCTGPNGKEWPCGTLARTALRSFLLGRTITCDVPDPNWKGMVTAECRFAKLSIGDWLARNGWAEVASGSPYAVAADEARNAGRGVYGNDPRKKHQSTLAPEPPKDDPLNPI